MLLHNSARSPQPFVDNRQVVSDDILSLSTSTALTTKLTYSTLDFGCYVLELLTNNFPSDINQIREARAFFEGKVSCR